MRVDGEAIARERQRALQKRVAALGRTPTLVVIALQSDRVTEQFVAKKREVGERIGVRVVVEHVDPHISTEELCAYITERTTSSDGVVVQLPLPDTIDRKRVYKMLPASHDVDVLGDQGRASLATATLLPPVVGAIAVILKTHNIAVKEKKVLVVGKGRLVGHPAAEWFAGQGAVVETAGRHTEDMAAHTRAADIIVLGAGVPGLLTPDMISSGAIILDAGTSETGGQVRGDADPSCIERAGLFTPTPGGIGPVAVTILFENLMTLIEART